MQNVSNSELLQTSIAASSLDEILSPVMLRAIRLVRLNQGEYLISQGQKLKKLYFLVKGKLQIEHYERDGNRAVFSIEKAFSVIGDLELFHSSQMETVSTVKALSQVEVLSIPLDVITEHGLSDPVFLKFICTQLSEKLYASSRLHSGASFSAMFKVRKYLAFRTTTDGLIIQLEKREPLAAMLGISVRQLNRVLGQIADLGIIQLKNKTVTVLDCKQLTKITPSDT